MAKKEKRRYPAPWEPTLRYAKDRFGGTIIHTRPNREMRRRQEAFFRTTVNFPVGNGQIKKGLGERSRARQKLKRQQIRAETYRPIRNMGRR